MRTLVAALLLLPTIAAAASPEQICRSFAGSFLTMPGVPVTTVGADQCEVRGAQLGPANGSWTIDRLVIVGLPHDTADTAIPPKLHLEAHGVRFGIHAPPIMAFVSSLNARPLEALADWSVQPDGTASLQVSLLSQTLGMVSLAAIIDHPPRDYTQTRPEQFARLREFRLHMDNRGFFESFIGSFAAGRLVADAPDPAARFAELTHQADALSQMVLSGAVTSDTSRAAVSAFLTALPHPDKPLDLYVSFVTPVEVTVLTDPSRVHEALAPGSVVANYGD